MKFDHPVTGKGDYFIHAVPMGINQLVDIILTDLILADQLDKVLSGGLAPISTFFAFLV